MLISIVEGSFEVKLPTIWTDGKAEDGKAEVGRDREEKRRRDSGGHDFFLCFFSWPWGRVTLQGFWGAGGRVTQLERWGHNGVVLTALERP